MKKLMILTGFDTPYNAHDSKKRYEHYRSFNRKDAIMTYIQAGVALTAVAIVCTGLYLSR